MSTTGAVMAGLTLFQAYRQSKSAKKESRRAEEAQGRQRSAQLGFAGPENYIENVDQYREAFREGYMPAFRGGTEIAALRGEEGQQYIDTQAGRRGTSGSGMHMAAGRANVAARSANLNELWRRFSTDVERGARGQARATSNLQVSAGQGAPVPYVPRGPGFGDYLGEALPAAAGAYTQTASLQGYGGSGWRSWFRKPQAQATNFRYDPYGGPGGGGTGQ